MGKAKAGRPRSVDYTRPIRSNPEKRARLCKGSEAQLLAKAANLQLRKNNCADIRAVATNMVHRVRTKSLVRLFMRALFLLMAKSGNVLSPYFYGGPYARLKHVFFSLLSHSFKNIKHEYNRYEQMNLNLMRVLPGVDRALIFGLSATPYAYNTNLVTCIRETIDEHISEAQIEDFLCGIGVKPSDSLSRLVTALLILACEQKLPEVFFHIYGSARDYHAKRKNSPESRAINVFANRLSELHQNNNELREEKRALTIEVRNERLKNEKLTIQVRDGKLKNEILTNEVRVLRSDLAHAEDVAENLREKLEAAGLIEFF